MPGRSRHAGADDARLVVRSEIEGLIEQTYGLRIERRVTALPRLLQVSGTKTIDCGEIVWHDGEPLLELKDRAVGSRLDGGHYSLACRSQRVIPSRRRTRPSRLESGGPP